MLLIKAEHPRAVLRRSQKARIFMKREFRFDDYEIRILILALNELRNQLIREERHTDAVDELLIKLFD